jgi:hypothetical protein
MARGSKGELRTVDAVVEGAGMMKGSKAGASVSATCAYMEPFVDGFIMRGSAALGFIGGGEAGGGLQFVKTYLDHVIASHQLYV